MAKQIQKMKDSLNENQHCLQHTACCRKIKDCRSSITLQSLNTNGS